MRIIQNLIRYNTDKATEIAKLGNKDNPIILYITNKKNWFTYQDTNNSFVSLTETEAALFLENHCRYDLLEEYFGHLLKDA